MAEPLVLQHFVTPARGHPAGLYYRSKTSPRVLGRHGVALIGGSVLRAGSYFNGCFEDYWRQFTNARRLALRVRVSGAGELHLVRRFPDGGQTPLARVNFSGKGRELLLPVPEPAAAGGLLSFELRARSRRLALYGAEWVAWEAATRPVRLTVGYCTREREEDLLQNLNALLGDPTLAGLLARVVVADQGDRKLCEHPDFPGLAARAGDRLLVVEQENHGGAGGFTRCILEARRDPATTHVLLTDDDALVDPESVYRAGTFLALARGELALSGQLLNRHRPGQLVDVGGDYDPGRVAVAPAVRRRVDRPGGLTPLQRARQNRTGGWWFFAFPLGAIDRAGLPLPLFLRGDDVEFGCRLSRCGVPTVPLPGVAVRHEAIDRARRGWQVYYDLRNMLVVGALHFRPSRRAVQRRFLGELLGELLAWRYAQAWLLCEAAEGYLRGPARLRDEPVRRHRQLLATWKALAPGPVPPGNLRRIPPPPKPRSRPARVAKLLWRLACDLALPDPATGTPAPHAVADEKFDWHAAGNSGVAAVAAPEGLVLLRRSRATFVRLLARGLTLSLRLLVGHGRAARAWRAGAAALATGPFWRARLGIAGECVRAGDAPARPGRRVKVSNGSWRQTGERDEAVENSIL
jgi:galactofuranosylgalactofuranosylrhamnosyl-N-acetylglucosaminyl-diphospho-decaprenol beta-1,5/1,6-galactofuranosyltransferase